MNPNLLKLILILGGGILVIVVGFIFQRKAIKKRKKEEEEMMKQGSWSGSEDTELSPEQEAIKNYILNYKSSYSREQIKAALIQAGNDSNMVEEMMNKYYN